jgi:uncharacterized protein YndB with AHSA1/START domain
MSGITLVVRRVIRASAARLFEVWTKPEHLLAWWGPRPVTCESAEVDLRVGGQYRIVNRLPDGKTITIAGDFRQIDSPNKLVYTWCMADGVEESSLVTVRFEARAQGTEVIIVHEQIPSDPVRESHVGGWNGCLDSLTHYVGERD